MNADPSNWSAHRLLSDVYAQQPRQNVARTSELFQSLMFQPVNTLPIQPQSQESSLPIVANSGPTDVAFNEFHPLFARNGTKLQADGSFGNNGTWGDNLVLYGLHERISYSLGQFHYETDGFRDNNGQKENIYDAFAQFAPDPRLSLQAEYRHRDSEQGDLDLRFDPDLFSHTEERNVDQDVGRIGLRFSLDRRSDLVLSLLHADRKGKLKDPLAATATDGPVPRINEEADEDGYQGEVAYVYRGNGFNANVGGAWYDTNFDQRTVFDWTPVFRVSCPPSPPFPPVPCEQTSDRDRSNRSGYAYLNLAYPYRFIWTLGASYDDLDVGPLAKARANPKLGAQWDATDSLRLRAAYFETLRRSLIVEQTLEPTQVAGFTQFFDDRSGTEAKRYGVGVDAKLTDKVLGGAEWSKRDLRVPQFAGNSVTFQNRDEDLLRAYLYWTPVRHWALSAESRT